jgi:hypothetical protein
MGDIRVNMRSILIGGAVGFLGVWVINRGLKYAGLGAWAA